MSAPSELAAADSTRERLGQRVDSAKGCAALAIIVMVDSPGLWTLPGSPCNWRHAPLKSAAAQSLTAELLRVCPVKHRTVDERTGRFASDETGGGGKEETTRIEWWRPKLNGVGICRWRCLWVKPEASTAWFGSARGEGHPKTRDHERSGHQADGVSPVGRIGARNGPPGRGRDGKRGCGRRGRPQVSKATVGRQPGRRQAGSR